MRTLAAYPALLVFFLAAATASCQTAQSSATAVQDRPSPWTVVDIRERQRDEVPFEESSHYLWPSPDRNSVLGPDSLRARVRIDEEHHPHLELEDLRTGDITPLLDASTLPHWSPDGTYIACSHWKSQRRPWDLAVVEVASRKLVVSPDLDASVSLMKWSPDSRALGVAGVFYRERKSILYALAFPAGSVAVLDTVDLVADYNFAWSPDGRWIAFTQPTQLDHLGEDPVAADLWIVEPATRRKWCVLETPDWIETSPLWITNRSIQIDRTHWDGSELGVEQRRVVELTLWEASPTSL